MTYTADLDIYVKDTGEFVAFDELHTGPFTVNETVTNPKEIAIMALSALALQFGYDLKKRA